MSQPPTPVYAEINRPAWAFVSGGSRGIGRAIVEAFVAEGRNVAFTYQNSHAQAASLAQSLTTARTQVLGMHCDGTDEQAVFDAARELIQRWGAPGVVVNNAGITRDASLLRMTSEAWHSVVDANLSSAFYVIRAFAQPMIDSGGGVILNMSSVTGIRGNPGQTNYAATKAGLIGMTKTLAHELGRFNVRVNAVVPGFIATEMVNELPPAQVKTVTRTIPLRRFGHVNEVAGLCSFLAGPTATYITGQAFVIDGGLTA